MFAHVAASHKKSNINTDKIHEAYQLYFAIYNEIGLSPVLREGDSILLGDIGKALVALDSHADHFTDVNHKYYSSSAEIYAYFESKQQQLFQIMRQLELSKDDSSIQYLDASLKVVDALKQFFLMLFIKQIELEQKGGKEFKEEFRVVLYRAANGELALRFNNSAKRDEFAVKVGQGQIDKRFVNPEINPQYKSNPTGLTPAKYEDNSQCLFCPSYQALNEEFAVNLTSKLIRDKFIEALGVKLLKSHNQDNGQVRKAFGTSLFTTYDSTERYHGVSQESALYFAKNHAIFNEPGAYLKINMDGSTTEGRLEVLPNPSAPKPDASDDSLRRRRGAY